MKFGTYETQTRIHPLGGRQYTIDFSNGYGASIICGNTFFRCDDDTYEVAVTRHGHPCYTTPITNDVLGHQTAPDVAHLLASIQNLPRALSSRQLVTWHPTAGNAAVLMFGDRPVGYARQGRFRLTAHVRLSSGDRKFTGKDAVRHARTAVLADQRVEEGHHD